jgi:hypothetical protein
MISEASVGLAGKSKGFTFLDSTSTFTHVEYENVERRLGNSVGREHS